MKQPGQANLLVSSTSPYLRQHAYNPVAWRPWNAEALEEAKKSDKPIFLSVGYSSCHWCHVMAHESFEDDEIAKLLNEHFICIKVDREELPDIDALYMTATQLMTQRGGWPNSVWLTPDGRPWYAGTYFPKEDRGGRIGFKSLLRRLHDLWVNRRKDVEEQANMLTDAIHKQHHRPEKSTDKISDTIEFARTIQTQFQNQFDPRHGGFGDAPKFPPHSGLFLLLRSLELHPSRETEIIIRRTLDAMAGGGIYDQIGGGFHRYSTDDRWLLPHFEKMLYDNALLLKVYALAANRFNEKKYARIAIETAHWLIREMTHEQGGFFSALDADSGGEEGLYYLWSQNELAELLENPDTLANFCRFYRILPEGNFHDEATGRLTGANIPHCGDSADEAEIEHLTPARNLLLEARSQRIKPGLDDKIITSWNGLMIAGLAAAGKNLNATFMINAAIHAREFIAKYLTDGQKLYRCWCGTRSDIPAYLDDHAALILADIELYEATGQQTYLDHVSVGTEILIRKFMDPESNELFMTGSEHATIMMRMRDVYDQGSPSGTGLAAQALARAGKLLGRIDWMALVHQLANKNQTLLSRVPSAVSTLAEAILELPSEIHTSSGEPDIEIKLEAQSSNQFLLTFSLPDGWKLNPLSNESESQSEWFYLEIEDAPRGTSWTSKSTGNNQWLVELQSGSAEIQNPNATVIVRYQPCTDTACLTMQSVRFKVSIT
ncbi:MAG TPA: thioredoxin domain-containing protein [Kiritimatiellia bacterium]|nr:thioredoxin domain-containing protein [Kiritimatiellia bacterium]